MKAKIYIRDLFRASHIIAIAALSMQLIVAAINTLWRELILSALTIRTFSTFSPLIGIRSILCRLPFSRVSMGLICLCVLSDTMSVEDINRFTRDDIVCALEMFNEDYVTFPRDDIAKLSGMTMPVNKRNWRKRSDHVRVMNTMKSLKKQLGEAVNLLKSQAPIKKSYRQKKSIAKQRRQNGSLGRLK